MILFLFNHGITQVGRDIKRFIWGSILRYNQVIQVFTLFHRETLQEWHCTISMGMSCPTAQVSSWEGHGIHSYKRMSLFRFFCLWPLPQRLAQTSHFPPCRHHVPAVRSSAAISAPGWISPSFSACHSTDQFDHPHCRPSHKALLDFMTPLVYPHPSGWQPYPQTYWWLQFVDAVFHLLLQVGSTLTKLLNRVGPRTDPCSSALVTDLHVEHNHWTLAWSSILFTHLAVHYLVWNVLTWTEEYSGRWCWKLCLSCKCHSPFSPSPTIQ